MKIAILLPHMDDEVFIIPYLVYLKKQEINEVTFYYLTKSQGRNNRFDQSVRESESTRMIKSIFPDAPIEFLGRKFEVEDLFLHEKIDLLFEYLLHELNGKYDQLVSTHFEGGHIDHDSAGILSFKLAKSARIQLLTFNLYSARSNSGPFYRVAKPIYLSKYDLKISIHRMSYSRILLIPFVFKSQIRTWVGIYPALFWRLLIRRKFSLNLDPEFNPLQRPNDGKILYENRKDGNFQPWSTEIFRFLEKFEK
jgi:hypothetical protein